MLPTPNPEQLIAATPATGAFVTPAKASIFDGTEGPGHPRLVWAKYHQTPWGMGPYGGRVYGDSMSYGPWGSRHDRERGLASGISQQLALDNPVIATAVEALVTNAIGTGLTLSAKPDATALGITEAEARKLSRDTEKAWREWTSNPLECDLTGRKTFHELAATAIRSYLITGEYVATLPARRVRGAKTRTKVLLLSTTQLDASRTGILDDRYIFNGVAFDKNGRLTGYYIRDVPLGQVVVQPMSKFVPAFTSWGRPLVSHGFEQYDPRQTRGYSPIAASLTPAQEREAASEFVLGNFLLQNSFAMTVESELPPQQAFGGLEVNNQMSGMDDFYRVRDEWYSKAKINPQVGTINHLAPGDKLRFNKAENPSASYRDFDMALARKAAKAAGLSYEDMSGDFSSTSFSASRWAADLPNRINLRRRKIIAEKFYRDAFHAFMEEAIETGAIEVPNGAPAFWQAPEAYLNAKFLGAGRAEPDPAKAMRAHIDGLTNNILSLSDVLAEQGKDLEEHLEQVAHERAIMAKLGLSYMGVLATQERDEVIDQENSEPAPPAAPVTLPKRPNR